MFVLQIFCECGYGWYCEIGGDVECLYMLFECCVFVYECVEVWIGEVCEIDVGVFDLVVLLDCDCIVFDQFKYVLQYCFVEV